LAEDLVTVEIRQPTVENQGVRNGGSCEAFERMLASVRGLDDISLTSQDLFEDSDEALVVVDDETARMDDSSRIVHQGIQSIPIDIGSPTHEASVQTARHCHDRLELNLVTEFDPPDELAQRRAKRWWARLPTAACEEAWKTYRDQNRDAIAQETAGAGISLADVWLAFRFGHAAALAYTDDFWNGLLERALERDWLLIDGGQPWAVMHLHVRRAWSAARHAQLRP
jgi:hypothetical protein